MSNLIIDYIISSDKTLLQIDRICKLLSNSYWAQNRSKDVVIKSIENSMCFGVYANNLQIGFARAVTDYATAYWLCDVIIDEAYRGKGLGKALMKTITESEELKSLSGILGTKDAHGLYLQYGFKRDAEALMRRRR